MFETAEWVLHLLGPGVHIALDSWALSAAVVPTPSLDLELIF